MRRLSFFTVLLTCLIMTGYSQNFPVARHFWLNDSSYNHTLALTSDGGYILAAARQEQGAKTRNTVAVFKLDNTYDIRHPQTLLLPNAQIIGIPVSADEKGIVNFEVHYIIESDNNGGYYVICGSLSRPGEQQKGMVIVTDLGLNIQFIREYEQVETFYSVYAIDQYYYVCGNMRDDAKRGIVMRDEISNINPIAYVTNQSWTYHKIKAKAKGGFSVSGTDKQNIGFTSFDISTLGTFSPTVNINNGQNQSYRFPRPCNSKAVLTNYPGNAPGIILSASNGNTIYTYLFNNIQNISTGQTPNAAFQIQHQNSIFLEDVNCSPNKIVWTGNYTNTQVPQTAFYASMIKPAGIISPPFPTTSVLFVNFSQRYSLHKVHFNKDFGQEFHCGGFYQHHNGDRTTFVVAPEQVPFEDGNCGKREYKNANDISRSQLQHLPVNMMLLNGVNKTWKAAGYDYWTTDCDDGILNQYNSNISK